MLLDIIIMHKRRKGIIVKDLRGLEEILSGSNSIKYKIIESNNENILRIRIETKSHNNNKSEAQALEEIKKKIRESEHRVNYYINVCYDGATEYYCNKLMIPLAIFERNFRQFLYLILISIYDIEWPDRFISKEVINDIKKKNNNININKLPENGLEYLTFQNYIDGLFISENSKSIEEIIKEVNNEKNKEGATIEDIVNIINNNTEKTMWEDIFNDINDIKIEFSREDIDNIRKIRNEVVHNKEIKSNKYEEYKKIINESNKKIKILIKKIEEEKYRDRILENIKLIVDRYKEILDSISNAFKVNVDLIKPINDMFNRSYMMEDFNEKIYSNQFNLPAIQNPLEGIKKFENIINDSMNKLLTPINQNNRILTPINQSLYLKNFNTVYKDENREENNKDNENKKDND